MREIDSSISVPPRSLTPQRSASRGGVEPHLHPARLQVRDRLAEREPEDRGVLEVLLARDLLDPVRAAEQRVERDEAERHELGEPARALLQLAHDAHVLGQLPRLLDVAEHHRHGRPQAAAVRGLDDLDPAADRQLVRGDPLRARRRAAPRPPCRESSPGRTRRRYSNTSSGRLARALAHEVHLHRRVRVQVHLRRHLLGELQPAAVVLERVVRVDPALHADLGDAELDRVADLRARSRPPRRGRRPASACPGRTRRRRSRPGTCW